MTEEQFWNAVALENGEEILAWFRENPGTSIPGDDELPRHGEAKRLLEEPIYRGWLIETKHDDGSTTYAVPEP